MLDSGGQMRYYLACKVILLYTGGPMDDKTLEMTMLYDFFGDLLTEKQRYYFDLYYNDDLSLSEIAEQADISRQGVRDIIMRAEHILKDYESKTGIVSRFLKMQSDISSIENDLRHIIDISQGEVRKTAEMAAEKVENLKG